MFVKKQRVGIVLLAMLTTAILASTCFAAEGETVKLQGLVSVIRDANDVIVSVQLVADKDTYDVVLNAKGLELGENTEGEKVEVEGIVSQKDNQKWLKVLTFKAVEEEEK
jgi:DNA/RNA endonuclease YhcR with UshA esterase domain